MDYPEITTISMQLPLKMGTVNAYLLSTRAGFILIDTGPASRRGELTEALSDAGCEPGRLKLVLLTHGDFDHTGNCAYLNEKYGAPVAMHPDDAGMLERGDMFWNRRSGNVLIRVLAPIMFGFPRSSRLSPDLRVENGHDLREFGLDGMVVHIPGHSKGSIGIVTSVGDLFCGDLLENIETPAPGSIIDDQVAASASLEKLKALKVAVIYPGHGQTFHMNAFPEANW